ncbi:MAG: DUF1461 domain-containing protein [Nanoarchaeota archaeon]|nr:DUF1461 domain-containing protein [DPANN group archaeon]MBL7116352.1 DUF1461 domain-containing protein [Nanoarchaeota archaeon]
MKTSEKTFFTLAVVFLIAVIIIAPLRFFVFNESYYYSQFDKNNVNVDEQEEILDNLLLFFKGEESLAYFTEEEQSHLEDVKALLNKFFFSLYISVLLFFISIIILFFINKKQFKDYIPKIVFLSGLVSFTIIVLFFLASLNFSMTFKGFHKLFFSQGNYLFPESSLLITLFPAAFFKSFFLRLMLSSFLLSIIAMALQLILNKMKK